MSSSPQAQAMLAVLGSLAEIAASRANIETQRDRLRYQHAIAELQTGALTHMIDAVVSRRVDAVQEGFLQVLREFAAQAQHYMAQQDRFATAELETTDPLRRIELRKRINDADAELRQIRLDAQQLYARMTEVVLLIGGSSLRADDTLARQLMIAPPMM
jgi:hypothetical protein